MINNDVNNNLNVQTKMVTCDNSSINFTIYEAHIVGNIAHIYLFGASVTQLFANRAYFIPNLIINGFESKKLYGIGGTKTVENKNDGNNAYICAINISNSNVCIVPNKDIPSGYGIEIEIICVML